MANNNIEEMFNAAANAAEADDQTKKKSEPVDTIDTTNKDVDTIDTGSAETEAIEHEVVTPAPKASEVETYHQENTSTNPITEPVNPVEKNTVSSSESKSNEYLNFKASPKNISQLLSISDLYRGFDEDTKKLAKAFFKTDNESEAISLALQQDIITLDALTALANVHKADDVDKAFFLVSLDDNLLKEIGRLIQVFTDKKIEESDHITYCRDLEKALRDMDDTFIGQTNSLLGVLQAAQRSE